MIKNKLIRNIKNKNGNGIIFSCILVLAFMMILAVMLEYSRTYTATENIRDMIESTVSSIATNSYEKVYPSQREGYFSTYEYNGTSWKSNIKNIDLDKYLNEKLGVKKENGVYVKKNKSGEKEFELTDVKLNMSYPEIAPTDEEKNKDNFSVELTANVKIYKSFTSFITKDTVNVKLGAKAGYMAKF